MPSLCVAFLPTWFESIISAGCLGSPPPKITSCIDPLDWFTKELYWPWLLEASRNLNKKHRRDLDADGDQGPLPACEAAEVVIYYSTNSVGWCAEATTAVSSALRAKSRRWEGVGMAFKHRLKRTGDPVPPQATAVCMLRVNVAAWKDHWNVSERKLIPHNTQLCLTPKHTLSLVWDLILTWFTYISEINSELFHKAAHLYWLFLRRKFFLPDISVLVKLPTRHKNNELTTLR